MTSKRTSKILVIFFAMILAAAALAVWRPVWLPSFVGGLFGSVHADVAEVVMAPRQLALGVDATGLLRATSVQFFGAPPEFGNYWQFQIVSMVAEGKNVKKGDSLISFDAQKVRDDLQKFQNELDQAAKELERTSAQIDLEKQELNARLADAQNRYQKQALKLDGISPDIKSYSDIKSDRLSLEQSRREVEALKERIQWHQRSSDATFNIIVSKKARAQFKVEEIKRGLETFQVKSDRDGVIVYMVKWNNTRYQVGENCYSGQPLMQIPDLSTILIEAYVPEVDIGKVRLGQGAEITIDALPGRTFRGIVQRIGTLVRTKSWDMPNKVLEVQIALESVDTAVMRPAMTVRTRIETAAYSGVLVAPLTAVRNIGGKAVVRIREGTNWADRAVELGESNNSEVIVTRGLQTGDRVAVDYMKTEAGPWK